MAEYEYDNERRTYTRRRSQSDPKIAVGGTAICSGDSGGPLVKWAKTKKGLRAHLIGIVAVDLSHCGFSNGMGIFTRLLSLDGEVTKYISIY